VDADNAAAARWAAGVDDVGPGLVLSVSPPVVVSGGEGSELSGLKRADGIAADEISERF
jgi:hypothetical protein